LEYVADISYGMTCNFDSSVEIEGPVKITGSQVHGKSGNIWKMVHC